MQDARNQLIRVEPDSRDRCQCVTPQGQCRFRVVSGLNVCILHNGRAKLTRLNEENVKNYRLTKYNARVGEFHDSLKLKSLREEIAILRMTLEERLNACTDQNLLLANAQSITNLVKQISSTVQICHTLDLSLGQYIDKETFALFATDIIQVLAEYVQEQETLQLIAEAISTLGDKYAQIQNHRDGKSNNS